MVAGRTLYSLQYLRAIATFIVVARHAYQIIGQFGDGSIGRQFEIGSVGVDIFFVISGFIMCFISEEKETKANAFFRRRLVRVAPTYWLITLIAASLIALIPSAFRTSALTPDLLLASLLFIAWPHPAMHDSTPLYLIGWTLNCEFMFYTLMSICLAISWSRRMWLATFALIFLVVAGFILQPQHPVARFYTNSVLIEFVFGMLIWRFWHSFSAPKWLAAGVIVLAILAYAYAAQHIPVGRASWWRFLVWGLPSAAIVFGAVELEKRGLMPKLNWLRFFGDASYGIYLVHFLLLGALRLGWHLAPRTPDIVFLVVALAGSFAAGSVFYVVVEKRLIAGARRLLLPEARSRVQPVAPAPAP
jgi:exopolysaccharide production protein ExoZ